jgi:hypothetical protein
MKKEILRKLKVWKFRRSRPHQFKQPSQTC